MFLSQYLVFKIVAAAVTGGRIAYPDVADLVLKYDNANKLFLSGGAGDHVSDMTLFKDGVSYELGIGEIINKTTTTAYELDLPSNSVHGTFGINQDATRYVYQYAATDGYQNGKFQVYSGTPSGGYTEYGSTITPFGGDEKILCSMSADGKYILVTTWDGGNDGYKMYKDTGSEYAYHSSYSFIGSLTSTGYTPAFVPSNNNFVITGTNNSTVWLFKLYVYDSDTEMWTAKDTVTPSGSSYSDQQRGLTGKGFSYDGSYFFQSANGGGVRGEVWSVDWDGNTMTKVWDTTEGNNGDGAGGAISPDNRYVVLARHDGSVYRVYENATGDWSTTVNVSSDFDLTGSGTSTKFGSYGINFSGYSSENTTPLYIGQNAGFYGDGFFRLENWSKKSPYQIYINKLGKYSADLKICGLDYKTNEVDVTSLNIPAKTVQISAGGYATMALTEDGSVYMWGDDEHGHLGQGTSNTDVNTPVKVTGLSNITKIACGLHHALALASDGTLYAWGDNAEGQCGDGSTTDRTTPVEVSYSGDAVSNIAAGAYHSALTTTTGKVYCWGQGTSGEIGDNSSSDRTSPTQVVGIGGSGTLAGMRDVSCGEQFTHAIKDSDGSVCAWGKNYYGALGDGNNGSGTSKNYPVSTIIAGGSAVTGITQLSSGGDYVLMLKSDGTVYACGYGALGQMGDGVSSDNNVGLVQVVGVGGSGNLEDIIQIAAAEQTSLALKDDGTMYSWGNNNDGQTGLGTVGGTNPNTPNAITLLTGVDTLSNNGKANHFAVTKSDGSVYCWGRGDSGQIGDGTTTADQGTPTQVLPGAGPSVDGKFNLFTSPSLVFDDYNKFSINHGLSSLSSRLSYGSNVYDIGTLTSDIIISKTGEYVTLTKDTWSNKAYFSNATVSSIASTQKDFAVDNTLYGTVQSGNTHGLSQGGFGTRCILNADGTRLLVTDPLNNPSGRGRAYIYHLESGSWTLKQTWNNPAGNNQRFADSACMNEDGTRIFLQFSADNHVYVYEYASGAWETSNSGTHTISAGAGMSSEKMGVACNKAGDVVIIGYGNGDKAYIYRRASATSWSQDSGGSFTKGRGVAINGAGTRAFVGHSDATVHVTDWSGSSWSALSEIIDESYNGWPTEIQSDSAGETLVIVTGQGNSDAGDSGIYERASDGSWSRAQGVAAHTEIYGIRNSSISYDGTMVLVGNNAYDSDKGRAQLWQKSGGSWSLTKEFLNPDASPAADDYFGAGCGIAQTTKDKLVIGMLGDDTDGTNYGSVWTYTNAIPKYLDYDTYNKLTINDITPTSTTLKYGSNTYDIDTATSVYIKDVGTYDAEITASDKFALVSNVVSGTLTSPPDYTDVWCGEHAGMIVDRDGKLYTWGNNNQGESGRGASDRTPTHLSTISDPISNVWTEGGPARTRVVKTTTDKWYMWGLSGSETLVFGDTSAQVTAPKDVTSYFTTYFGAQGASDSTRIIKVVVARFAFSALAANGKVWSWGKDDNYNELGNNTSTTTTTPFKNTTDGSTELSDIVDIGSLHYGKIALDSNGDVWLWGQLRTGSTARPTKQTALDSITITGIGSGFFTVYAWDAAGNIYTLGQGTEGQLLNGATSDQDSTWQTVTTLQGQTIYKIYGQGYQTMVHASGGIYMGGHGANGRLGLGNNDNQSTLVKNTTLSALSIHKISFGNYASFAITTDGKGYAWGGDAQNSIPTPLSGDQSTPVEASSMTNLPIVLQVPSLDFDTYNKLSISGITPTSTTLKYGSNTYDIDTATSVYIEDAGTYDIETKNATTFALTSNTSASVSDAVKSSTSFNLKYEPTGGSESRMPELSIVNGLGSHTWSNTSSFSDINGNEYEWMFIGEESYDASTALTTVALPYTVSVEVVTGSPASGYTDRIWNGKGSSTDNTEQKNCDAVNGIVEIKGTYTSAITPAYLLVAFTSGAKSDLGNGHLKTIDIIVDGTTYFSIDLGTTNGIAAVLMANHPTNATNHSLFAIKLPSKINVRPNLKFDGYNKLTFTNSTREWPPASGNGTLSAVTRTNSNKKCTWTVSGASYGNGEYTASSSEDTWSSGSHLGYPDMAFNKSVTSPTSESGFMTDNTPLPVELIIKLPTEIALGSYKLQGRNYGDSGETPKDWTLQGSNDGETWTVIDTQTGVAVINNASYTPLFTVSPSAAYNRYKLHITANTGGSNNVLIGEWYLYEDFINEIKYLSNTYDIGTASSIYIENAGTYEAEGKSGAEFALTSNVASGTITPYKEYKSTVQKILPSNDGTVSDNDYYGYVGISGNGLVMVNVGRSDDDTTSNSGGFMVYEKVDGAWTFTQQITGVGSGSGSLGNSDEGKSVQLDYTGTRVFLGSHGDDHTHTNSGSVYIYRRVAKGNWTLEQRIDGGGSNYKLGYNDVNNDGDKLLIGSYGYGSSNTGRAWYYTRSGTTWSLQEQLAAPDSSAFGNAIGMNSAGTRAAIGGYTYNDSGSGGAGRVYIWNWTSLLATFTDSTIGTVSYDRTSDGKQYWKKDGADAFFVENDSGVIKWNDILNQPPVKFNFTQTTSQPSILHGNGHIEDITSKNGWYLHYFGTSDDTNSYLGYTKINIGDGLGVWSHDATLTGDSTSMFGWNVDISNDGNTIVVAAHGNDKAYIYDTTNGTTWTLTKEYSGYTNIQSIQISGDGTTVVAGDPEGGSSQTGYSHVYIKSNGSWPSSHNKRIDSDRTSAYNGHTVAISDTGDVISGAFADNESGSGRGAVYVYEKEKVFDFDGYDKLSINGITPTSSTLKYGSNTYDIGTATNIYIKDAGTYNLETKNANTFVLASNVNSSVTQVTQVITGGSGCAHALTYDGKLYGWGENSNGELGVGDSTDKTIPTLCTGIPQGEVASIWEQDTYGSSRWAKTKDGRIWVTGDHDRYALPNSSGDYTTFIDVSAKFGDHTQTSNNVVWATGSERVSIVLMENGDVWTYGDDGGSTGGLGQGASPTSDRTPRKLSISNVTKVAANVDLKLALDSSGNVFMWGRNEVGNSAAGWGPYNTPTNIMGVGTADLTDLLAVDSETVTDIYCSYYSMFVLTNKGTVYGTGKNGSGQLGQGNTTAKTSSDGWVKIDYFTTNTITVNRLYVGGAQGHVFADTSDGWYCWGKNGNGNLALGDTTKKKTPVKWTGVSNIKVFGTGNETLYAIAEDGKYYAWGDGQSNARGDADTGDISYPKYIDGLPNILAPSFEFDGYDKIGSQSIFLSATSYGTYVNSIAINSSSSGWSSHTYDYKRTETDDSLSGVSPYKGGTGDGATVWVYGRSDAMANTGYYIAFKPSLDTWYDWREVGQSGAYPNMSSSADSNGRVGDEIKLTMADGSSAAVMTCPYKGKKYYNQTDSTKFTKNTVEYDAGKAPNITVSDPGTYDVQLLCGDTFSLKSTTIPATKTTGLYTWAFHHGNFDNAYGDGDILTARDNGRFYADTPAYTGAIGTITPTIDAYPVTYTFPFTSDYPNAGDYSQISSFTDGNTGDGGTTIANGYMTFEGNNDTNDRMPKWETSLSHTEYSVGFDAYFIRSSLSSGDAIFFGGQESSGRFELKYVPADHKLSVSHARDGHGMTTTAGTTVLADTTWYNIKVVFKHTSYVKVYIDNVLEIDHALTGSNWSSPSINSWYMGAKINSNYSIGGMRMKNFDVYEGLWPLTKDISKTTYTFAPPSGGLTANVMMVAGGGGGGGRYSCGGGGAGGLVYTAGTSLASGATKTIVVGNGDSGGLGDSENGFNGKDTTFTGLTSAVGGGAGGTQGAAGATGGSGGGGGGATGNGAGGSATSSQGNAGGTGSNSGNHGGGGGGGSGAAGSNGGNGIGGNGGTGKFFGTGSSFTNFGDEYGEGGWFASGGGGGTQGSTFEMGFPGRGGGGYGQGYSGYAAKGGSTHGMVHTGGGGGGSGTVDRDGHPGHAGNGVGYVTAHGGRGGSGIVLIQTNVAPPNGANTAVVQVGNPRRRCLLFETHAVDNMGSEVNRWYIIDSQSIPTYRLATHWYGDPISAGGYEVPTTHGSFSVQKRADGSTSNVWYQSSYHYFADYGTKMAQTADAVFMPVEAQRYDVLLSIGANNEHDIQLEMAADGTAALYRNNGATLLQAGTITCFTVGKWHHIALTVDSEHNAVGYVNGYPVVSATYTSNPDVGSREGNMYFRTGVTATFRKFLTYEVSTYNFHMTPKQVLQRAAEVGCGPKLEYDDLNTLTVVNTESGSSVTIYEQNTTDTSNIFAVSCESSYTLSNAATYYAEIKGTDTYTITRPFTVTDDHFPLYSYPPRDGTNSSVTVNSSANQWNTWTVSGAANGNGQYQARSNHTAAGDARPPYSAFRNDLTPGGGEFDMGAVSGTRNLDLQLPSAKIMRKYVIWLADSAFYTGNTATTWSQYDPVGTLAYNSDERGKRRIKSWTIQGSNNYSDWTTIHTVTNQPPSNFGDVHTISSPGSYLYYRISVTDHMGSSELTILCELVYYGDA